MKHLTQASSAGLTEALTTHVLEYVFFQNEIVLAGETYIPLADPADYQTLGGVKPDLILLRRESDGALFEAWVQAGVLPAHKPLAPAEAAVL